MRLPLLLIIILFLASTPSSEQNKTFTFSHTQVRNNVQQWENKMEKKQQTVSISDCKIDLQVSDEQYHLDIVTTTHLPDNGVIYLCKNEQLHDITVMLISDEKMYVYDDKKRFLINFSQPLVMND